MRLLSTLLLPGLLLPALAAAAEPKLTFEYEACSYSFEYPADLVAAVEELLVDECGVTLRPVDMEKALEASDGVDVFTTRLSRPPETFLVVADLMGFDFRNGTWITVGRTAIPGPAEAFRRGPWSGIRGVRHSGCDREDGYGGLCDVETYVLRNDEDVVFALELAPSAPPGLAEILIDGFRGEPLF